MARCPRIRALSVAPLLGEAIQRIHEGLPFLPFLCRMPRFSRFIPRGKNMKTIEMTVEKRSSRGKNEARRTRDGRKGFRPSSTGRAKPQFRSL